MTCRGRPRRRPSGPYLSIGLPWPDGPTSCPRARPGAIRIGGRVYDGAGEPSPTRWSRPGRPTPTAGSPTPTTRAAPSAAEPGSAASAARRPTTAAAYEILTVKPGPLPVGDAAQAPHIDVSVFARGMLDRVRHPDLLRRRGGGQRGRPGAVRRRRPSGARTLHRRARAATATASTSTCRATRETVFFAL